MEPSVRAGEKKDYPWESSAYPYLEAAKLHYNGVICPQINADRYPLTWEKNASQADYAGNLPFFPEMYKGRICAPHTWHAAELYLWIRETGESPNAR